MVEITLCERVAKAIERVRFAPFINDGAPSKMDVALARAAIEASGIEQLTTDLDTVVRALTEIREAVEKRQLPITNQIYEIADEALSNIKREGVA